MMFNRFYTPPVVKNLIIANCIIFLAIRLLPLFNSLMAQYGCLYWFGSPMFHSWQFVTYMFLHASMSHLFFNMFALWMFGRTLEYELGSRRFLLYYVICGVGAALVQMGVVWLTGEYGIQLLGASGAVMGLLLAFGVMHPNNIIMLLIPPIPMKAKWFVVGYAVLELFQGWGGYNPGVAHFAHVGGMLWGWLLLTYWKRSGKIYY
ncbi:MAG: rhomboid family intramembrane serine protease [Alistipes sp.]|nr:rhomboid family intramembrane serine protease [Alistipes sp.]